MAKRKRINITVSNEVYDWYTSLPRSLRSHLLSQAIDRGIPVTDHNEFVETINLLIQANEQLHDSDTTIRMALVKAQKDNELLESRQDKFEEQLKELAAQVLSVQNVAKPSKAK